MFTKSICSTLLLLIPCVTKIADLDGSGIVDTPDLLAVIAAWGACE